MDILVVGRAEVIANVHEQHPTTTLGNTKGVRTWLGDVNSIPAYQVDRLGSAPFIFSVPPLLGGQDLNGMASCCRAPLMLYSLMMPFMTLRTSEAHCCPLHCCSSLVRVPIAYESRAWMAQQ